MLPLGRRLAVERASGERVLASGIVLPEPEMLNSRVGIVRNLGRSDEPPFDVAVGDRVIYSSRADTFVLDGGETIDIVDANSVIGIL